MSDEGKGGCVFAVFAAFLAIVIVASTVIHTAEFKDREWQREAVKRGYAEYNATTGAWQWKQTPEASHDER